MSNYETLGLMLFCLEATLYLKYYISGNPRTHECVSGTRLSFVMVTLLGEAMNSQIRLSVTYNREGTSEYITASLFVTGR